MDGQGKVHRNREARPSLARQASPFDDRPFAATQPRMVPRASGAAPPSPPPPVLPAGSPEGTRVRQIAPTDRPLLHFGGLQETVSRSPHDLLQRVRAPFAATGKPTDKEKEQLEAIAAQVDAFVEQAAAEFGSGQFAGWEGERFQSFFSDNIDGPLLATWAGNAIEERVYQLMTAAGIVYTKRSAIFGGVTLPDIVIPLADGREAFIDITSDLQRGHILSKAGGRWVTERRVVFAEESVYASFTVEQLQAIRAGGVAKGYQAKRDARYYEEQEKALKKQRTRETDERGAARESILSQGWSAYVAEKFAGDDERARAYMRSIKMSRIPGQYEPKAKHMARYENPKVAAHKRLAEQRRQARRQTRMSPAEQVVDRWSKSARSKELRLQGKENEQLRQLQITGVSEDSDTYQDLLKKISADRAKREEALQEERARRLLEAQEAQSRAAEDDDDEEEEQGVPAQDEDPDEDAEEQAQGPGVGSDPGTSSSSAFSFLPPSLPALFPSAPVIVPGHEEDYAQHFIDDGQILTIDGRRYRVGAVADNGDCLFESVIRLRGLDVDAPRLRAIVAEYAEAGEGDVFGDAAHVAALKGGAYGTVDEDLAAIAELYQGTFIVHVFAYGQGEIDRQPQGSGEPEDHLVLQGAHFRPLHPID